MNSRLKQRNCWTSSPGLCTQRRRSEGLCFKFPELTIQIFSFSLIAVSSSTYYQVFIRELISNGSDALEKLRHKLVSAGGATAPMEIHLQTDGTKGTFTIQV